MQKQKKMEKITMKTIDRLKLELAKQEYFSDDEYAVFLEESGLDATEEYNKINDEYGLLNTVLSIFEALNNNVELFMKIQTEFVTTSSAYESIKDRIDALNKRIALVASTTYAIESRASSFTQIYVG